MYLHKNIDALKKKDPELATRILSVKVSNDYQVLPARNGSFTLKKKGIPIHSIYDPQKEADSWLEKQYRDIQSSPTICVFGFGLGYHVEILTKSSPRKRIVVFEPDLRVLKCAFSVRDLKHLISNIEIVNTIDLSILDSDFIILKHPPSIRFDKPFYDQLEERLRSLKLIKSCLKIIVVGPIYGGSLPIANYVVNALKRLGHNVEFIDFSLYKDAFLSLDNNFKDKAIRAHLQSQFINLTSCIASARCKEFKPDIIISIAQAPLNEICLSEFRKLKIPTVFWFVEDFRIMTYWERIAKLYDFFFVIQKGEFFDLLRKRGIKNFYYLPLAADPEIHKPLELNSEELSEYGSDISFVGAGYYNRRCMFEGLLDFNFKIWGNEWDLNSPLKDYIQRKGERIEPQEYIKIFNATKININLHSSPWHRGVNPDGDFINPRTFEIAACGAFQLVDFRNHLPELYDIGKEIVCFTDINDLREKIQYYLEREDERSLIAERAREKTLSNHTYKLRLEEMLDFIIKKGNQLPDWGTARQPVEQLISEAESDQELTNYLKKFKDHARIELDDIIEDIKNSEGELKKPEKIFILMNEIKKVYLKQ